MNFKNIMLAAIGGFLSMASFAQKKQLTDVQYFQGNFNGLIKPLPSATKWNSKNQLLYNIGTDTYVIDPKVGVETKATDADKEIKRLVVKNSVYNKGNDIYFKKDDVEIRLTNDDAKEVNATLSPDGNYVAFTKNNDLYTVNTSTKEITRLTTDGSDLILNGYASWVYMEEILGRSSAYRSFWWSPDSKKIAFFRSDDTEVPMFTMTDANGLHGYVEKLRYPKVGDKNPEVKVGIVAPTGGAIAWADFNEKDDQYFGQPYWKPDGSSLLQPWMNRLQNKLVIYEVSPANGSKKAFYTEEQKTWISLDDNNRILFLNNGKEFILESDVTGYNHLYWYDNSGKLKNAITSGNFTVTGIEAVDEKNKMIYFSARGKENTARRDIYSVGLNGKGLKRLSFGDFNHQLVSISPDYSSFVTRYSNASTPARMALVSTKGKLIKELGSAKGDELDNYDIAKAELIRVKSADGLFDLPMMVTWPLNMDKNKTYPVLISIYGGPNMGTVMDNFSLSGTQQFYAKEGLIQVAMDHRASGHFGKAGVNYMYHNLGDWELKDYATMVDWLVKNGNADPARVCITGFSYGGYMSCLAVTKFPQTFKYGMAGGSVTDWTLYDSHYTERFMGTPANNPEGYKTSNVMNFVDGYDDKNGMLQIVHGVIDENVHLQNSMQLIAALQDKKKNFEMMLYSQGRHGWRNLPARTAHFDNLKTQFIYKYLLRKEVPTGMLKK